MWSAHDQRSCDCVGSRAERAPAACPAGTWSTDLLSRIAPTARDEESRADPSKNPDLDYLLRGTVQDTTARRMGGVAGHAGVFSTAHDVSVFAQALLDRLAGRPSEFPLTQATVRVDDDSAAARPYGSTTPSGERGRPGSHRKETECNRSAARSALSGDLGAKPARLWLGYRYAPFHAARHGLSHR